MYVGMKRKSLKDMCAIWREMTEFNNHGGVLLSIAKYFGLDDLKAKLEDINKRHDEIGYLRFDLFVDRLNLEKELLATIQNSFGEDVYKTVYDSMK